MKVTITKILGVNKLEYLNYKTDQFNFWCALIAHEFYLPKRILQSNQALYAWYCTNWDNKITNSFLVENQSYIEANIIDDDSYQGLFKITVVAPLKEIYPSSIIDRIKKKHYENLRNKVSNNATRANIRTPKE